MVLSHEVPPLDVSYTGIYIQTRIPASQLGTPTEGTSPLAERCHSTRNIPMAYGMTTLQPH